MVARAPRKRMYRTMQGRMVDIEKLRAANEGVQAVGNMNVNARGDVIGPGGQIITKKETVIKKYYEQPKGMVDDSPTRAKPMPETKPAPTSTIQKMSPVAKEPQKQPVKQPAKQAVKKPLPTPEVQSEPRPVGNFKPKTETIEKKGIDAALDGLE